MQIFQAEVIKSKSKARPSLTSGGYALAKRSEKTLPAEGKNTASAITETASAQKIPEAVSTPVTSSAEQPTTPERRKTTEPKKATTKKKVKDVAVPEVTKKEPKAPLDRKPASPTKRSKIAPWLL